MRESRSNHETTPLEDYVAALVECGGPLTTTVAHMRTHGGADAAVGEVLSGLLSSVLEPLESTVSGEQLRGAAAILRETTEIVCREVFLVADAPRAVRRAARGRRRPE